MVNSLYHNARSERRTLSYYANMVRYGLMMTS